MSTITLSFDEELLAKARQMFETQEAIAHWMENQLSAILQKVMLKSSPKGKRRIVISDDIKALSDVPSSPDFDYKDDLLNVLSEKYS